MYISKGRRFETLHEYFNHIADTFGAPRVHEHFESDSVISDGLKLHVDVYEYDPEAPTIVFIPGTAIYSMCYGEMLHKLGESGFNIVGFDPRGHGRSEGIRGDYTIPELMRDTQHVITYAINRFNKQVSVMGSSQGGIVAFYLAAIDNRIQSVICQCLADMSSPETEELARWPLLIRSFKSFASRAGNMIPNIQMPVESYIDLSRIPLRHFGSIRNFVNADPLCLKTVSMRALLSLAFEPVPKPIEEIKVPVMILLGTADSIFTVPYTQRIFDRLQCQKELVLFHGKSHAMLTEDTDEVASVVSGWMNDIHQLKQQSRMRA